MYRRLEENSGHTTVPHFCYAPPIRLNMSSTDVVP